MSSLVPLRLVRSESASARLTYTVNEVSDLLGLSLGLTYAAVRSGEIPARKLGCPLGHPQSHVPRLAKRGIHRHEEVS